MIATKVNRTARAGRGRGLSIRLVRAIAKKFSLSQIIVFTSDDQRRQRILSWGRSNHVALEASDFATQVARLSGWPKPNSEIEIAFVRKLKGRIKELEAALAQIVDGCPDPAALARAAGKFPDESDAEENLGEWIFYPQGKLSRGTRTPAELQANIESYNVLTPEQLDADNVNDLAFRTAQKLALLAYGNVAGEIETAIKHAMRRFKGWRWNGKE